MINKSNLLKLYFLIAAKTNSKFAKLKVDAKRKTLQNSTKSYSEAK